MICLLFLFKIILDFVKCSFFSNVYFSKNYKMTAHFHSLTAPKSNTNISSSMFLFQEIFDDQDVTNFDKYFYKSGVMDWVQSQVLRIYNCSILTLNLKNGKDTISKLLAGKLLIVEDVEQLVLTGFTAGMPYSGDDTVSSITV